MSTKQKLDQMIVENKENSEFKIHRSVFTDPEVMKIEMEKIFGTCWLYLGHESELSEPGRFVTRQVGGRDLIFNRDAEGNIHSFYNSCMHRGALVCREREGKANAFQCFYHAWTYNNKGDLVGVPGRESYPEDFNKDCDYGLQEVSHMQSYFGFVFVNFNPDNETSLEDYLGEAKICLEMCAIQSAEGMEVIKGTHDYAVDCNWKLVSENSADPYHALPTHKTYFDFLATKLDVQEDTEQFRIPRSGNAKDNDDENSGWGAYPLGNGHFIVEGAAHNRPGGRPAGVWESMMGEHVKKDVEDNFKRIVEKYGEEKATRAAKFTRNMVIFPNLVINDTVCPTVRTFYPTSPDYLEAYTWCLGAKDDTPELRQVRLDGYLEFYGPGGFASPDDNEALELCQRAYHNNPQIEWNLLSRGMNKELENKKPDAYDEYHIRSWWRQWHKIIQG